MLIVAHRLSTIRDADNIIVMSKGATIEQGSHFQLIDMNGAYARLVKAQDLGKRDAEANETIGEDNEQLVDLDRAISRASDTGILRDNVQAKSESYGLVHGGWLIFKESRELWFSFSAILLVCLVGGESQFSHDAPFMRVSPLAISVY